MRPPRAVAGFAVLLYRFGVHPSPRVTALARGARGASHVSAEANHVAGASLSLTAHGTGTRRTGVEGGSLALAARTEGPVCQNRFPHLETSD